MTLRKATFFALIVALGLERWSSDAWAPIRPAIGSQSTAAAFIMPSPLRPLGGQQQQGLSLTRRNIGRLDLFGKGKTPEPPKQKSLMENLFGKKTVKVEKPTRKRIKVRTIYSSGVALRIILAREEI